MWNAVGRGVISVPCSSQGCGLILAYGTSYAAPLGKNTPENIYTCLIIQLGLPKWHICSFAHNKIHLHFLLIIQHTVYFVFASIPGLTKYWCALFKCNIVLYLQHKNIQCQTGIVSICLIPPCFLGRTVLPLRVAHLLTRCTLGKYWFSVMLPC